MYKECEVVGDNIYVVGGQIAGDYRTDTAKTTDIQVFNTVTNKWSVLTGSPYAAFGVSLAVLSGKIYMSGGAFNGSRKELYRLNF